MDYLVPQKPKNWLVESILVTILCCLPFGIAGIIYASQVDGFYMSGQYDAAQLAAKNAAKWTKVGFFVAIGLGVLYVLFIAAIFLFGTLR